MCLYIWCQSNHSPALLDAHTVCVCMRVCVSVCPFVYVNPLRILWYLEGKRSLHSSSVQHMSHVFQWSLYSIFNRSYYSHCPVYYTNKCSIHLDISICLSLSMPQTIKKTKIYYIYWIDGSNTFGWIFITISNGNCNWCGCGWISAEGKYVLYFSWNLLRRSTAFRNATQVNRICF